MDWDGLVQTNRRILFHSSHGILEISFRNFWSNGKRPLKVLPQIYDTCFPLKKLKGKNQSRKPWLSKGLLKSVKSKGKLYKQYLTDPSSQKKALYKEYRNKLNHSLKIAKRLYYGKKLNESKNNLRATWRVLNDLINKRKPKVKSNTTFKAENQEISDPVGYCKQILSIFFQYRAKLGQGTSHKTFLSGTFNQSFFSRLGNRRRNY